jgi:hypothetical protein
LPCDLQKQGVTRDQKRIILILHTRYLVRVGTGGWHQLDKSVNQVSGMIVLFPYSQVQNDIIWATNSLNEQYIDVTIFVPNR